MKRSYLIMGLVPAVMLVAAGMAYAAPTITAGTTPPSSHVDDGRADMSCSLCHTVTQPAPAPALAPAPAPAPVRKARRHNGHVEIRDEATSRHMTRDDD